MGELRFQPTVAELISKNQITADDVLKLRRETYADGVVSRNEADMLFALDNSCRKRCAEWDAFFVEALTDYLVYQEVPKGFISEENAQWLIRAISRDSRVDTRTELELLIVAMEKAESMPSSLSAYAMRQVAHAVMNLNGALAKGRQAKAGVVTETDVQMLRRIMYAYGGAGQAMITREEAEVLFEINDRTSEAANHPSWSELFTKAIGYSVLASLGYAGPTREDAMARQEWLDDTDVNVGGFFSRVFAGGLKGYVDKVMTDTSLEKAYADRNRAFAAENKIAENIDAKEAEWLVEMIGRDGKFHKNEMDLLRFIKQEARDIHPKLAPLLEKVA